MKIPKKNLNEIIAGMLPLLADRTEQTTSKKQYVGSTLKNFLKIQKDVKGNPIIDSKTYTVPVKVEVQVNHERRIKSIINSAKTMDEVTQNLGDYLAANAKSRGEVVTKIRNRKQ